MSTVQAEAPLFRKGADAASQEGSMNNSDSERNETAETDPQTEVKGCHPRECKYKCLMLLLMCLLSFGSFWAYDTPAALQKTIINVMQVNTVQYTLLYSLYAWPNVILSVFGGYLLHRVFGIRWGTVTFSTLVCIGHFIFALGAFFNNFITMGVGRFIFGIGGEILTMAQSAYVVSWFNGKQLGMFVGFLHSVSRTGSSLTLGINNLLFDSTFSSIPRKNVRLAIVLMIGFVFCILSLGSAAVLGLLDKKAKKIFHRKESEIEEKFSLKYIKGFPLQLWIVFIICGVYYLSVFPFIGLAQVFVVEKYKVSFFVSGILVSVVFIASSFVARILGQLVEWAGFNLFWLNLGIILSLGAHAMIAFLGNSLGTFILALIILGVAYALVSGTLWPLVALIVPDHQLGTAYGIMQGIESLGLAVVIIGAGTIVDRNGYLILEVFFIAILCVAVIAGIILYFVNFHYGGKLNMSSRAREKKANETAEESAGAKGGLKSRTTREIPDYLVPLTLADCPRVAVLK